MTATTVQLCRCGHAEQRHNDEEGCDRSECGCAGFRAGRLEEVTPQPNAPTPPPSVRSTPVPRPAQPAAPGVASAPTIEQILALGERSPKHVTRSKVARIRSHVDALRRALMQERAAAEAARRAAAQQAEEKRRKDAAREQARREVAELEAKLKAARARLVGNRPAASTSPTAPVEHGCTRPGCTRTFATGQARAMHERRAHDGFDPNAAKASA